MNDHAPANSTFGMEHDIDTSMVTDMHVDIHLDAFHSGALSALATVLGPDRFESSQRFAREITSALQKDPVALEAMRRNIAERLQGIDGGPRGVLVEKDSLR